MSIFVKVLGKEWQLQDLETGKFMSSIGTRILKQLHLLNGLVIFVFKITMVF